MKRLLPVFAVFFIWACDNSGANGTVSDADSTMSALDTLNVVDANVGNDSLSEYVRNNPFDVNGFINRAKFYLAQQNARYAAADAAMAMELDSTNPEVLLLWGDVHYVQNKTRVSRDSWNKCIQQNPENVDCRLKLAELYLAIQNYRESTRLVNEVIELDPTNAVAYFIKATNVRDLAGDTALSLRFAQQAIEYDPDYFAALDYAATMSIYLKNRVGEGYFQRMIELAPENSATYYKKGMYHMEFDDYNKAIQAFTKATELRPTDAESYFNLGYIHLELGLNQQALAYFNASIEARQVNHRAYYGRGFTYEKMGDLLRAKEDYAQALAYNPGHYASRVGMQRIEDLMNR